MKLTKRYLREVHSSLLTTADVMREAGLHFLAVALTPNKTLKDATDVAACSGRVRAVIALLKLNPPDDVTFGKVLHIMDGLKVLLKIEV